MGIWYCTREDVKSALDFKETARNNGQIDRAIDSASRAIEGLTHRRFYPELDTRYFDWPNAQYARPWRLWLDQHELISVTALSSGGTTIAASDYFLEPVNDGPPYDRVEIDLDSPASFGGGNTHQRDITITGIWGYTGDHESIGTLAANVTTTTATTIDVSNSAAVGVGDVIHPDYGGSETFEHMIVTGKTMIDSTQNTGGALTAAKSDVTVPVTTGSSYNVGEVVLVDSERMLIVDIAGNNLTVVRAWDGTVLASHSSAADIYYPRRLTVTRGVLGTTAATQTSGVTLAKHVVPSLIRQLAIAEAIVSVLNESSGYGRTVGSGDNEREAAGRAVAQLRQQAKTQYARMVRIRGV